MSVAIVQAPAPLSRRELCAAMAAAVHDADELLGREQTAVEWQDCSTATAAVEATCAVLSPLVLGMGVRSLRAQRCAEVLARLQELRAEAAGFRARRAFERQEALGDAIGRLRGVDTVDQLTGRIPDALRGCGFGKAWVSRLARSSWQLAGSKEMPHPLVPGSHEAEMARRRSPVLVIDARSDGRVDPVIAERLRPRSYVAAPLVVDARVVGFVHAAVDAERTAVDEDDRSLLALFAEACGHMLERVFLAQRLQAVRREVRALTASIDDTVDERCWGAVELASGSTPAPRPSAAEPSPRATRIASLLTARELEVLRLMAMGETNPSIASELVISEGTVKSHVKHILRKLHATNRAQAVSRYLRIAHG